MKSGTGVGFKIVEFWNKHTLCVCCVHVVCMFSISLQHFELCGCMRWALLSNCRATVRQAIVEQPCRTTVRYGAVMQIPRVSHHLLLQCTSASQWEQFQWEQRPPSIDCYVLPRLILPRLIATSSLNSLSSSPTSPPPSRCMQGKLVGVLLSFTACEKANTSEPPPAWIYST